MVRIDSHIHLGSADRFQDLEVYQQEYSLDRIGLISLPDRKRINFNPELLSFKILHPQTTYILGEFDYRPGSPYLSDQVEELYRIGFDGLKLILGKPAFARTFGITLQDPSFTKAFDRVSTLFPHSFPILVHVGDPYYFWETPSNIPLPWTYSSKDPPFEECIALAEHLVKRFPHTVFIFPHLLFLAHQLDRLESILLSRPGVYTDLSPGNYFYADLFQQKKRTLDFLVSCKDRILFGTDGFFFDPRYKALPYTDLYGNLERTSRLIQFLEGNLPFPNPFIPTFTRFPLLNGLNLREHPQGKLLLEKLYSVNFLSLFGNSPRPLHMPSAYAYLETFLIGERTNSFCAKRRRMIEDTLTKLEESP